MLERLDDRGVRILEGGVFADKDDADRVEEAVMSRTIVRSQRECPPAASW